MTPSTSPLVQRLFPKKINHVITREDWIMIALLVLGMLFLLVGIVFPLYPIIVRSLQDTDGNWVGLTNYQKYLSTPALTTSLFNTFFMSIVTAVISVVLGFIYAYALTRTAMSGKFVFRLLGILPLYIRPIANAIGLQYLFGNKGLVTEGLLGILPGWNIGLYGLHGIVMGEFLNCFPQAVVILTTALSLTDARLYEAAESLRTHPLRTFFTITIPSVKFGLINTIFVCFIVAFTDFGVPKVVGGDFNVLAIEVYKQVIGQQNFSMGATISVFLLLPTVFAFIIDRILQRRQTALVSAKSVPLQPKPNPTVDWLMFVVCSVIAGFGLIVFLTVIMASFVKVWPYDFSLTFKHYDFSTAGGGGYEAYWNSIQMSLYTAIFGTIAVFVGAYLVEKAKGFQWLRLINYFLSTLPLALPGLVLGLGYVFFFNKPLWPIPGTDFSLVNPFNWIYSTMTILVLCNIIHFYTVSFLTGTTTLKQIDPEFEAVSASMRVPFYKTFWRVTVPLSVPAILEIGIYYFINSMVTISALIFIYPPSIPLASVAIINMDDAGDVAPAAAMSTLVIATSIGVRLLYSFFTRGLYQRTQAWLKR